MAWQTCAGVLLTVGGGTAATAGNAVFRVAQERGLPGYFEMCASSLAVAGLLCGVLALQGEELPRRDRWFWLFVRGFTTAAVCVLTALAVAMGTPLGDVSALLGLGNVLSGLWGRCLLKERLRWSVALPGLLLGSAGAVIVARPRFLFGSGDAHAAAAGVGYAVAAAAAVFMSLLSVSARKLVGVPSLFQTIVTYVLMAPVLMGLGVLQGEARLAADLEGEASGARGALLCLLALSAVMLMAGTLQSKGSMLCAVALSSTANISSRVISGYAFDVLFFGGALRTVSLCGAALMVLSSAMLVLAKPAPEVKEACSLREADVEDRSGDVEAPAEATKESDC